MAGHARINVLLLTLLVPAVFLAACGSDEAPGPRSTTAAETTTSPEEATVTLEDPAAGFEVSETVIGDAELSFSSPTGNINCSIIASAVRCDVLDRTFEPPATENRCEFDYGSSIGIDRGGDPQFLCVSDAVEPGPVLEYGTYVRSLGFTCTSSESGVGCNDDEGGGSFLLSRESYELESAVKGLLSEGSAGGSDFIPGLGKERIETVDGLLTFSDPDGNIGCQISPAGVRCDIAEHEWESPPAPPSCTLDFGDAISASTSEPAHFVCHGLTIEGGEVLGYDRHVRAYGVSCTSFHEGVDCEHDDSGQGFFISRQSYELE